jgi:predicted DNA-binding transcriptional regulator YafY
MIDSLSEGLLAGHFKDVKQRILQILGMQKEGVLLTQHVKIIPIANPIIQSRVLNKITTALSQQKRLNINFWNRHLNEFSQRQISPLQLVRYRDHWLVDAYCHEKNALRSFSLEAILAIKSSDLEKQKIDQSILDHYFQSSYGIFSGQADKVAVLEFTAYQARWIKDQVWHPDQQAKWLESGRYQLQLPYSEDAELIQDILKYAAEVEVISPLALRQKVREKLEQACSQYSK